MILIVNGNFTEDLVQALLDEISYWVDNGLYPFKGMTIEVNKHGYLIDHVVFRNNSGVREIETRFSKILHHD